MWHFCTFPVFSAFFIFTFTLYFVWHLQIQEMEKIMWPGHNVLIVQEKIMLSVTFINRTNSFMLLYSYRFCYIISTRRVSILFYFLLLSFFFFLLQNAAYSLKCWYPENIHFTFFQTYENILASHCICFNKYALLIFIFHTDFGWKYIKFITN